MATIGEPSSYNSQADCTNRSQADVKSDKVVGPHGPTSVPNPMVACTEDHAVEEMKKEMEKMEKQMHVDKEEMQRLREHIEGLKGERVFESELFQFCRELLNMRIARGLMPLSNAEKARYEEIQKFVVHGIKQYTNAKGSAPEFICPSTDCPRIV